MLLKKQLLLLLAGFVILAGMFGPMVTMGLVNGEMHCDFMGTSTGMCPMTLAYHLDHWQEFFSATLGQFFSVLVIFSIIYLLSVKEFFKIRLVLADNGQDKLRNFLVLLFSQGILNPRIA